jgi:mono/diheme cytochrome c family protein
MNSSTDNRAGEGRPRDTEPRLEAGSSPHLFWLMALLGVLAVWGDQYLINRAADFHPQVYTPYLSFYEVDTLNPKSPEEMLAAKGRMIFQSYCQPCHQANGAGVPGQFPPLAGSDWVGVPGPNRIIRIVLNGFSGPVTVNGASYNGAMFEFRKSLSDDDIASVLTFVRGNREWGNSGAPVTSAQVAAIRKKIGERGDPWTAEELLKVPDSD